MTDSKKTAGDTRDQLVWRLRALESSVDTWLVGEGTRPARIERVRNPVRLAANVLSLLPSDHPVLFDFCRTVGKIAAEAVWLRGTTDELEYKDPEEARRVVRLCERTLHKALTCLLPLVHGHEETVAPWHKRIIALFNSKSDVETRAVA